MNQHEWLEQTLAHLEKANETGAATVTYLRQRRTPMGIWLLPRSVGAIWVFFNRGIYFNQRHFNLQTLPNDPRLLSLLVHETCHLQQGLVRAFSVFGELEAWQADFNFQKSITGRYPTPAIIELCALPLALDRDVLRRARDLMMDYGGKGYRADLLPLFPIHLEIAYWLGIKPETR